MQGWEIKYGQISIGIDDYEYAKQLFRYHLERSFDIYTPYGVYRGKNFLHYAFKNTLRLACKPFFERLKEGDIIGLKPISEKSIEVTFENKRNFRDWENFRLPIVERLRKAQLKSETPIYFERAVADAFRKLGFLAKHVGGWDAPDVVIEDMQVILKTKPTKEGIITERYVNFEAIERQREKYNAKHVGIVARRFSGGQIREIARRRNIVLIETETLCELLENHEISPYSKEQIMKLLFKTKDTVILPTTIRAFSSDDSDFKEIIARVLRILKNFEKSAILTFSISSLRIALIGQGYNYKISEIENALKFLAKPPFKILYKQNDNYHLDTDIEVLLKEIELFLDAFSKMREEREK